ncbi:MAG: rhomboid family intramembrane serine protease [Acidobacteria bacterium]|nr:rhomboid family intramembrane serine protease [Acidobacteriota bacterium]
MWYLGLWIAFQILAASVPAPEGEGGVAWFAHVGGFLTGVALIGGYRALKKAEVAMRAA